MDKQKAIASFLKHLPRLSRLPLISDEEMAELYGGEVAAVLRETERFDSSEWVCARCERRCCPAVRCELYAPQFTRCPVHDFRPVICRLHFCNRFPIAASPLMRELDDIFFESLLSARQIGIEAARLFDCPPFGQLAPGLVASIGPLVQAVRCGELPPDEAEQLIRQEASQYRLSDIPG
ncbi:MAG: hypothetical protein HYX85_02695 [Chloroflexi bacterium]|nr:hypothetical protein [Chloroflexota bacterium]